MSGSTAVDNSTAQGRASKNTVDQAKDVAKKKRRRRRIITLASVLVAILVIGGLAYWGLHEVTRSRAYVTPAHASTNSDGIVAGGTGPVRVDMYVDFQCPACSRWRRRPPRCCQKLVSTDTITLVYHPMSTSTEDEEPVLDPGRVLGRMRVRLRLLPALRRSPLFANQPPESVAPDSPTTRSCTSAGWPA